MSNEKEETQTVTATEEVKPQPFQAWNLKFEEIPRKAGDPVNQLSFIAHYENPDNGARFAGTFVWKRITPKMWVEVGAYKALLTGSLLLLPSYDTIATWIAYLRTGLHNPPAWWAPEADDWYDTDAIRAMHDYVRVWEDSFRRKPVGERRDSPTSGSGSTS